MKKVFITGGTGFIGRSLIDKLLQEQLEIKAFVRKEHHSLPVLINIARGSLFDIDFLTEQMNGCDTGYHLAACINFDHSNREQIYKVNVKGTKNFLEAARKVGMKRIILVSSACTIGISNKSDYILDENTNFNSRLLKHNIYLASKKMAEDIAMTYKDIQVIIANPTTVYGPGDYNLNSGSIIKTIVKNKIIPVFPGGTSVIDVEDLSDGLMLLGKKPELTYKKYIFTTENLTFNELFRKILNVLGIKRIFIKLPGLLRLPVKYSVYIIKTLLKITGKNSVLLTPQIIEDAFLFKYYSLKRVKEDIGWHPKYAFENSVKRAWEFYLKEGLI